MTETLSSPTDAPGAATRPAAQSGASPARQPRFRVLRRLLRQPAAVAALGVVLLLVVAAVAAPWIAPYDPTEKDFGAVLQGPSGEHLLGTDNLGQDTFSRIIHAARVALVVAFGSVAVAFLIGVPLGLLLGFKGGWYDRLGSRVLDVFQALPGMIVGFAVIAILGRSLLNLMIAIGLIFCLQFARITRGAALAEREALYVDAARVGGLRTGEILFRQVLPNLGGVVIVQATVLLGSAIMIEAALSFLGIGLDTDTATWGSMLGTAQVNPQQPFLAFPPGLAIILTVLAFSVLGDALNDALIGERRTTPGRRALARLRAATASTTAASAVEAPAPDPEAVLEFRGTSVVVDKPGDAPVPLVDDVWLSIRRGEVVGMLGESGSGKSMLARSALGLLPPLVRLSSGAILFEGKEIGGTSAKDMRAIRGRGIGVVFQDPLSALSPVHTIGRQLAEPLRIHKKLSKADIRTRSIELLDRVGVEDPANRLDDYPHQFSGGMAQRVAIAIALAAEPRLLIADEATSALDVTTQSQVLDLLLDLREEFDMAILLITHDLGVAAESCDRVAVMYAGQLVETADVTTLFDRPQHPYTAALLASNPAGHGESRHLPTIPGAVPLAGDWPAGCHFANRCAHARDVCTQGPVPLVDGVRCVRADELTLEGAAR